MKKTTRAPSIDDVVAFISCNAPQEGQSTTKNPFRGRKFPYETADLAIEELHKKRKYLDLEAYDLLGTMRMWHTSSEGTNYELARKATRKLLQKLDSKQTTASRVALLPTITQHHFHRVTINQYGTTLHGMLAAVYDNSPFSGIKDLIQHDADFAEFSDFQQYDMKKARRQTWFDKDKNKNYPLARLTTKLLLQKIKEQKGDVSWAEILPTIRADMFHNTPINRYGTTLRGMINLVYAGSPYLALKDLIEHDAEMRNFCSVIETRRHQ